MRDGDAVDGGKWAPVCRHDNKDQVVNVGGGEWTVLPEAVIEGDVTD